MIHIYVIAACVLASLPAFVPEGRWFYANVVLFLFVEVVFVAAILDELNAPIVDGSPNAILLPILPILSVIPVTLFVVALGFRFTAYLLRNVHLRRNRGHSAH